jgi:hypothetical protein
LVVAPSQQIVASPEQAEELLKLKSQVGVLSKRLQEVEDKNNEMAMEMAKRNEMQQFMKKAIVELE